MQVCYFTGDVCQVDWLKALLSSAYCRCNTFSGRTINRDAAKVNTARPEGKSSGEGARLPKYDRAQIDSPGFYTSNRCMWQGKGMTVRIWESERNGGRQGAAYFPRHSTLLLKSQASSGKGWSVWWNGALFRRRRTRQWSMAALHGVRQGRRRLSLYHKKVCPRMRIHDARWRPFSSSSRDEYGL